MGKDKAAREGRKGDKASAPDTAAAGESRTPRHKHRRKDSRKDSRKRWQKRFAFGVLVGVAIWAICGGLSGIAHAFDGWISPLWPGHGTGSHADKTITPSRPGSGGGTSTGKNPAQICWPQMASEDPLDSWEVRAWTFPAGLTPTASQVSQIDEANNNADTINRYLYDDGAYALFTDTQLILHNDCSRPMVISDVQALKSCQAPLDGAIFVGQQNLSEPSSANDAAIAGPGISSAQIGFDLDSSDPEAMLASGWNVTQWTQEYDMSSLATIPGNGNYTFDIRAIALHAACSFSIQITYLYNNKTHTEIITDDGEPFRVSALLHGVLDAKKPGNHPYAGYGMLYVGWHASPWPDGSWVRENPKIWP